MPTNAISTTLTLYQGTGMLESRNVYLDSRAKFLANFTREVHDNIQFPAACFRERRISIKLDVPETSLLDPYPAAKGVDYAQVFIDSEDGETAIFYYFVKRLEWVAQKCVRLELEMDVINTVLPNVSFNARTKVTRRHKDRFKDLAGGTAARIVDRFDEGFHPPLFKSGETKLNETGQYGQWNLVYRNTNQPDPDAFYQVNPVELHATTDEDDDVNVNTAIADKWVPEMFQGTEGYAYLFEGRAGMIVSNSGGSETLVASAIYMLVKEADGTLSFYNTDTDGGYIVKDALLLYGDTSLSLVNYGSSTFMFDNVKEDGRFNVIDFDYEVKLRPDIAHLWGIHESYDRTDPTLIRIAKVPYFPTDISVSGGAYVIPSGWNYDATTHDLKIDEINAKFSRSLTFSATNAVRAAMVVSISPATGQARSDANESKLFNSAFHNVKYAYDSFSCDVPLETITASKTSILTQLNSPSEVKVNYVVSTTMSGKFMFRFPRFAALVDSSEDYPFVISVARNNEEPIFTSAYVNYLRTGYNYDVKAKNISLANSMIGIGAGIAGGAASGLLGGNPALAVAGAVIGGVAGAVRAITQQVSAENAIQQKIAQARAQSVGIAGSDDVDLMVSYCGNRLYQFTYDPSPQIKQMLFDLFYYYGYACDDVGVPDTHTRLYFDFIQAEAFFDRGSDNIATELIDALVEKFAQGVTFIHQALGNSGLLITSYENWETSLM